MTLESGVDDGTFTPMSLVLDEKGGKLFTVSIGTPEAAVIDVAGKVEKVIDLGNSISASGVAFDAARNRLYVAFAGHRQPADRRRGCRARCCMTCRSAPVR